MDRIYLDCTWTVHATIDLDRILLTRGSALTFYTRRYQEHFASIWSELDRLFAEKHGRGIILHANCCSQSLPLILPLDWLCINHLAYDKILPNSSGSDPNFCAHFKPRYSNNLSHGVLRICLQSDWPLTAQGQRLIR